MALKTVDFYWDIGSTNTYFAFHLLRPLAAKYGATINYVPFNLGYVFRHHNYALTDEPAAKMKNRKVDLMRWARRYDLAFQVPKEFPIKTSRVARATMAMKELGLEEAFMAAMFTQYWEQGDASIQEYQGMAAAIVELGADPQAVAKRAEDEDLRADFIGLTQTALEEGIFGAPTMRVDGEIYWGKDRFEFIEDHLKQP